MTSAVDDYAAIARRMRSLNSRVIGGVPSPMPEQAVVRPLTERGVLPADPAAEPRSGQARRTQAGPAATQRGSNPTSPDQDPDWPYCF